MLFVLSPAKTLDFTPAPPDITATQPALSKDVAELAKSTHKLSAADLKRLMHISDKLADLNEARFKAFKPKGDVHGVQAALAFAGDVYEGLKARELDAGALDWAQDHMRILSGLYGVLRPLDRIQPYRLEMGIRLATDRGASLYDFWGDKIAKTLNAAGKGQADPTLVNLASQEYFGGVDRKALKLPLVTCLFKQKKADELRTVAMYAKTARGLMARFIIDNRVERAEDLKAFDHAGYGFSEELSTADEWLFVRKDHP